MGHHGTCEAWAALAISAGCRTPLPLPLLYSWPAQLSAQQLTIFTKAIANPKLKHEYELILFIIHMLKNIMCNTFEK